MRELYVFCEGPTEQRFVHQVLRCHLLARGFTNVPTILIRFSKRHGRIHRGGMARSFEGMALDIRNHLKSRGSSRSVFLTTMIDLYGLPSNFPGKKKHRREINNPTPYVMALEDEFARAINDPRFVPYIQLHEFETLLFADPTAFACAFEGCEAAIADLQAIANSVPEIEHIDDGEQTAPSKRIIRCIPAYQGRKSSAGPDIAQCIGLEKLRSKCPHFNRWVTTLEGLEPIGGGALKS